MLVGNYAKRAPTMAQRDAIAARMVIEHRAGRATRHTLNGGHRDASGNSTECPGDAAHATIPDINRRAEKLWTAGYPTTPPPTPPPTPKGPPIMLTLVKLPTDDAVWLSDPSSAGGCRPPPSSSWYRHLKARGVPYIVTTVKDLGPYGSPSACPPPGMRAPAWLLAMAFVTAIMAVVVLITRGHEEDVWQVLELATPVLAALFVLNRVDERSDHQDTKLAHQDTKLDTIERATNGELTARIKQAVTEALPPTPDTPPRPPAGPSPAGEGPSTSTLPAGMI